MKELRDIEYFIFDLDNTLYQGQTRVFEQVSKKMGHYISSKLGIDLKKAKDVQQDYFHTYNTTLNGLMIKDKAKFLKVSKKIIEKDFLSMASMN